MSTQPGPLWLSGAALVAAGGVAIGLGWTGQNAIWATAGVVLVLCGAGVIWQLQRRAGDDASERLDTAQTERKAMEVEIVRLLELVSVAASGDLTQRGQVRLEALGSVIDALNVMLEGLSRLVIDVRRNGIDVTSASRKIAIASEGMAQGAAKQASALDVVRQKIRTLGERAQEVGAIVSLIDDIAARTNLPRDLDLPGVDPGCRRRSRPGHRRDPPGHPRDRRPQPECPSGHR
jgi:hypothetical protein